MADEELPAWLTAGYEAIRRSGTNVAEQPTYVIPGWMADQYGGVEQMNATAGGAEVFVMPDPEPPTMYLVNEHYHVKACPVCFGELGQTAGCPSCDQENGIYR